MYLCRQNIDKMTRRNRALGSHDGYRGIRVVNDITINKSEQDSNCFELHSQGKTDLIRFADLSGHYIRDDGEEIFCCSIQDGQDHYQICDMTESDFWAIVKDKRLGLMMDCGTFLLNVSKKDNLGIENVKDLARYIFDALNKGRYSDVVGLTTQSPCFHFVVNNN